MAKFWEENDPLTADNLNRTGGFAEVVLSSYTASEINTVLQEVEAEGGGTVVMKGGDYVLAGDINLPSNVGLVGESFGSVTIAFNGDYSLKAEGTLKYDVGTISINRGSSTVTGSGTTFTNNVDVGDKILLSGLYYKITSVDSDTQLTIEIDYQHEDLSGEDYIIAETVESVVIEDLVLTNASPGTGTGISMKYIEYSFVDKIQYQGLGTGLNIQYGSVCGFDNQIAFLNGNGLVFDNCHSTALYEVASADCAVQNIVLKNSTRCYTQDLGTYNSGDSGMLVQNSKGCTIAGIFSYYNTSGIDLQNSTGIRVNGELQDNTTGAIVDSDCENISLNNIIFSGNTNNITDSGTGTAVNGCIPSEVNDAGISLPTVTTSDITVGSNQPVTLEGELTDKGLKYIDTNVGLSFEYGKTSGNLTNTTTEQIAASTGAYSYDIGEYGETQLDEDDTYYYRAKAENDGGVSYGTEKSFVAPAILEFGIQWNQTQDTYTRLDDAVGLSVSDAGSDGYKTGSDFDSIEPWASMRRCNVATDGTINAYYGDAGYADDGSNGDVMVEIPKFYYKTELDETGDKLFKYYVSSGNLDGYEVHPAFVRNGVEKDYIYIGAFEAYESGGELFSQSGVTPTASQTISTFRSQAEAKGTGWSQQDLLTTNALQLLYLVEYGDFNSQANIGNGWVDESGPATTGQTSGNDSYGDTSNQTTVMSYRGVENFYGSLRQFVDGFIIDDNGYYYEDDITNFNDTASGYTQISKDLSGDPYGDGYQDDLEYLTGFEFAFVGNSTGGTDSTYITDYLYEHDDGETNIAVFGGYWGDGLRAGAFYWFLFYEAAYSGSSFGARLLYHN